MKSTNSSKFFNIVLIGRPNVGKSSIFNFLISKNEAKVEDFEGTTIDWRSKKIGNLVFWDSPGSFTLDSFPGNIKIDYVFFVIDNMVLNSDKIIYLQLKAKYNNLLVIINKIDKGEDFDYSFFHQLIKISVKSRFNMYELKSFVMDFYDDLSLEEKKIWAILGKPNVGKSTLINKLIKHDLHKVEDKEGTTKELLPVEAEDYIFLDTPGQRNKAEYPKYGNIFGFIFVTDLQDERQDLRLISKVINRNKPIFVVINKIDLLSKDINIEQKIRRLNNIFNLNIIKISCLMNKGIRNVLNEMLMIEKNFNKRISTSVLNKWLKKIQITEPRLKFISQVETSPPKFFCDFKLTNDKEKMLKKQIAKDFNFQGFNIKVCYNEKK